MTRLIVDEAVSRNFPEVSLAVVTAEGVNGASQWHDTERKLQALESSVAEGSWSPPEESDPAIASWHALYRRFGTNPRRMRPSIDALCRRLRRSGRMPRVNAAVDTYNYVSVRYGLPAGAFDLGQVKGDLILRPAREGDHFTPLGEPDVVETPTPGEIVYADEESVLTRHWNHRDAERTKVSAHSSSLIFLLESAGGAVGESLVAAAEDLAACISIRARQVTTSFLHG